MGPDRAALAFSALSAHCAQEILDLLSPAEQIRLRVALERLHDASDHERQAALDVLTRTVREGRRWPRPDVHDEASCPFNELASRPRSEVAALLAHVAVRTPLEIAVALCHLPGIVRDELWDQLDLEPAPRFSTNSHRCLPYGKGRSEDFARDLIARLNNASVRTR